MVKTLDARFYIFRLDSHRFLEKDTIDFSAYGYNSITEAEEDILRTDLYGEYFVLPSYFIRRYSK